MSALKIIGKAGLSFEDELVSRRSCMLPRRGSGACLGNELKAVVWSFVESWLGGDEPLDSVEWWARLFTASLAVRAINDKTAV